MNHLINKLSFLLKSPLISGLLADTKTKPIFLEQNYLEVNHKEYVWLLPYRKHKNLLLALKRGQESALRQVAKPLAEIFAEISPTALVVPLPQSRLRVLKRGFNHVLLIVQAAKNASGTNLLQLEKKNLVKIRETRKQAKLSRAERLVEQKNSFAVRHPERIAGKEIILFDDIITTGATLSEARKVLLKAGAKKVICVALAH